MKKILLCILIIAGLCGDELDYDYIDETYNEDNITQSQPNNNKKRNQNSITTNNKTNTNKKLNNTLEDRKEASGFMLGAGMSSGAVVAYNIAGNMGFNLVAGGKWFHTPGFGQRLYFDYSFGSMDVINSNVDWTHDFALNYDLLFNWVKTRSFKFGMLLGLNIGFNSMRTSTNVKKDTITLAGGVNIGFRFGIFKNHSIEILGQPKLLFGKYNPTEMSYCDYYSNCINLYSINPGISVRGILRYVYTF